MKRKEQISPVNGVWDFFFVFAYSAILVLDTNGNPGLAFVYFISHPFSLFLRFTIDASHQLRYLAYISFYLESLILPEWWFFVFISSQRDEVRTRIRNANIYACRIDE